MIVRSKILKFKFEITLFLSNIIIIKKGRAILFNLIIVSTSFISEVIANFHKIYNQLSFLVKKSTQISKSGEKDGVHFLTSWVKKFVL